MIDQDQEDPFVISLVNVLSLGKHAISDGNASEWED